MVIQPENLFDFADLVNSSECEDFYTSFWKLTNIPIALVDPEDKSGIKYFSPEGSFNPVCKVIRRSLKGEKKCLRVDKLKMDDAAKEHKGICYQCHAGLTDFAVPIYVEKRHIATVSCGQIMTEAPTEKGFNELWDNVCELDIDKQALRKAYFESNFMSPEKIEAVLQLLTSFSNYFCEVGVRLRILEQNDKHPEIEKATRYLKEHFSEPITADDVADYVAFSRPYFSKLFKQVEGMTFTQYLQELRLEEVKKLLWDTDTTISKIAFNCGFHGLSYFNAFFRKMMNCSPSQYRDRVKNTRPKQ